MTATEAHDMLAECKKFIESAGIFQYGIGSFAHIQYCKFCHYSMSHGHGDKCLIVRLERATGSAGGSHE